MKNASHQMPLQLVFPVAVAVVVVVVAANKFK